MQFPGLRVLWQKTWALLWTSAVLALVLLAVTVSLGRVALPQLVHHQDRVRQWLDAQLPFPVQFDHLEGSWQRLSPTLHLAAVRTTVPVRGTTWAFSAERLSVEVDWLRSLFYRQLQLRDISLQGAAVSLSGAPLALLSTPEYSQDDEGAALLPSQVMAWVLNLGFVRIENSSLRVDVPGLEAPLSVQLSLNLEREGDFRRLETAWRFDSVDTGDETSDSHFQAVIEARQALGGGLARLDGHARLQAFALDRWLQGLDWQGSVPQLATRVDGEAWAHWTPGADIRLQGRFSTPRLAWVSSAGAGLPALDELAAEFLLQRRDQNWQLLLPTLDFKLNGVESPLRQVQIDFRYRHPLRIALAELDLHALHDWLGATGLLPQALAEVLDDLQPQGQLKPLVVSVPLQRWQEVRIQAGLQSVAVSPWHGAPGATGINGYLESDLENGFVDLETRDFSLDFPDLYAQAMHFETARARVGWQVLPDRVQVHSSLMQVTSPDGNGHGLLSLEIPYRRADGPPQIALVVGATDAPASARDKYIPRKILPSSLVRWLDDSIQAGQVSRAGFILHGPLMGARPTVQLSLDVHQATLRYDRSWPALSAIEGRFLLSDSLATTWATQASVYGSHIGPSRVSVDASDADAPQLSVQGSVQGPMPDLLRLFRESPLRRTVGEAFSDWQVDGRYAGQLSLNLALDGDSEPEVRVDGQLQDASLTLTDIRLSLKQIQGPLVYDSQTGLQSDGLQARLWQAPVQARIHSEPVPQGHRTRLLASADISVDALSAWTQQPLSLLLSGRTRVQSELIWQPQADVELRLLSDLQGLALQLPPPLGKTAQDIWPSEVQLILGEHRLLDARVGTQLRLLALPLSSGWGAGLAVGHTALRPPTQAGLSLYGRLEQLDWSAWQAPVQNLLAGLSSVHDNAGAQSADGFRIDGVFIDALTLFDQTFNGVNLSLLHQDGWRLQAVSDNLSGHVAFPQTDDAPYRVELERLNLPDRLLDRSTETVTVDTDEASEALPADATGAADTLGLDSLDWSHWPPVHIGVQNLNIGGLNLGSWRVQVRPEADTLHLEHWRADSPLISVGQHPEPLWRDAWLRWERKPGQPERTVLHMAAQTREVATVFSALGLGSALAGEEGHLYLDMQWPGHPLAADLASIAGRIRIDFSNGFIHTDRKAEAGLLKALGIFNIDEVLRRLRLDFRDLYQQGLAFDTAHGIFSLHNGWLYVDDTVQIKGPSSNFALLGKVDMVHQQLQTQLTVTLPAATSLPWLAAIAGGLPAAVGVYIASKLLEDQIGSFTSISYDVTGPFDDPQVKFQRLFDPPSFFSFGRKPNGATDVKTIPEGQTP